MNKRTQLVLAGAMGACAVGFSAFSATSPADVSGAQGPYSVFAGTLADMTWPDVEAAAKGGAVAIWGVAVIEEHGPALPLATDTYEATAVSRLVKADLEAKGVKSVIVPAFAWGVNEATGGFPGSIDVHPQVLTDLMVDVFRSLHNTGFATVFVLPGHGDAAHNRAIYAAVKRSAAEAGIRAVMVTNSALVTRIGLDLADPLLAVTPSPPPAATPPQFVEGHSGAGEHANMLAFYPKVVKQAVVPTLKDAQVTPAGLAEWRKGYAIARRITPLGYLGNPSNADPAKGRAATYRNAEDDATAILAKLQ